MSIELEREVHELHLGQHACFLYDDEADDQATIVPYFQDGLERGERCHFIADEHEWPAFLQLLRDAGVDTEHEMRRRSLFVDSTDRVLTFANASARLERRDLDIEEAIKEGFSGVRVCSQIPQLWGGPLEPKYFEFEAMLNDFVARRRVVSLCRYDLRRAAPALIRQVLRVHSLVVIGPLVCPNPFYVPPMVALGRGSEDDAMRWELDQLYRSRMEKHALEQAVRARDEFLSAASHELRTPLAAMQLHLQAIVRRATADGELGAIVPNLRRAVEQLQRCALVVQQLIDASLAREDRLQFHIEEVDLGALAREVAARFESAARTAGCRLLVDVPPWPVVGRWDGTRLEQVLVNLVSNALKFGAKQPVELHVSRIEGGARIAVRDHGAGISEADRERIFQRFERAAPVSHYGGFGLGLWIARKIVDGFGGSIVASNAEGGGALFTVDLPLDAATEQRSPVLH